MTGKRSVETHAQYLGPAGLFLLPSAHRAFTPTLAHIHVQTFSWLLNGAFVRKYLFEDRKKKRQAWMPPSTHPLPLRRSQRSPQHCETKAHHSPSPPYLICPASPLCPSSLIILSQPPPPLLRNCCSRKPDYLNHDAGPEGRRSSGLWVKCQAETVGTNE